MMGYHDQREIPNYWNYARNFVLQDHMFEPNASWSLPAHLFLVSEWSARCIKVGDPFSCASNIELPGLPPDLGPAPHTAPNYAWTDLTYLLHRRHVSWGYYVKKGPEPDCETGADVLPPTRPDRPHAGHLESAPQLHHGAAEPPGRQCAGHQRVPQRGPQRAPAGRLLGGPERRRQRASHLLDPDRPGVRDQSGQHDRPQPRLEEHGDLPQLG